MVPKPRYFGNLATVASLGLVKCSLVMQAFRIFVGKRTRVALWVTLVAIVLYTCAYFFTGLFVCIPISAYWEVDVWSLPADSPVRCLNFAAVYCQLPHRSPASHELSLMSVEHHARFWGPGGPTWGTRQLQETCPDPRPLTF